MNLKTPVLAGAAITTGVSAGLLFGYQVSVIPAFKTLSDADYIAAMQAINVAIQNPIFALFFFGAAIFLLGAAFLHRSTPGSLRFHLLVAATLLYIVGTLGITIGANVPLNDTLAAFSLHSSTPAQAALARSAFQGPWNTWHLIRTSASVGSLVLVTVACLSPSTRPIPANLSEKTT
jgi:uncharacterized membrane protein